MSRGQGVNITIAEDEALCRAYISISVDSLQGANQTAERLGEVITTKYHEQPGIIVPRTLASLQSRFSLISSSVTYFVTKLSHAMNS